MENNKFIVSHIIDQEVVKKEISVVTEGCYYYFNAQHIYLQLSTIERSYFDFISEKMDYEHRISLNAIFRKEYIIHYNKITSSKDAPTEATLHTYEKKLIALHLIISINGQRVIHYVNPKYVTKGTATQRKKKLQELSDMASKGEIDLSTIINRLIVDNQPKEEDH
jgi:hypothetical protein